MIESVPSDPEPLPAAGDFFTQKQFNSRDAGNKTDSQEVIKGIVSDVEELTKGGNVRINRRFESFVTEAESEAKREIGRMTLTHYGLPENHHFSGGILEALPKDNRAAEIEINNGTTTNAKGLRTTSIDRRYGIFKHPDKDSLTVVQKNRYKNGPDYFVSLSDVDIRELSDRIQVLKATPLQAD